MPRSIGFLTALLALVLGVGGADAQTAPAGTLPVTPAPEEFGISPREAEEVAALMVATPVAATPGTPAPAASPAGEPADRSTTAFVVSIVREALARGNGAGFLGAAAMATDNALAHIAAGSGEGGADLLTFIAGEPAPANGERRTLIDVREVRDLGDGRVSAIVVVADPTRSPAETLTFVVLAGGSEQYFYLIEEAAPAPDGFGIDEATVTPAP